LAPHYLDLAYREQSIANDLAKAVAYRDWAKTYEIGKSLTEFAQAQEVRRQQREAERAQRRAARLGGLGALGGAALGAVTGGAAVGPMGALIGSSVGANLGGAVGQIIEPGAGANPAAMIQDATATLAGAFERYDFGTTGQQAARPTTQPPTRWAQQYGGTGHLSELPATTGPFVPPLR
jgi:hypothetical protein